PNGARTLSANVGGPQDFYPLVGWLRAQLLHLLRWNGFAGGAASHSATRTRAGELLHFCTEVKQSPCGKMKTHSREEGRLGAPGAPGIRVLWSLTLAGWPLPRAADAAQPRWPRPPRAAPRCAPVGAPLRAA